MTANKTKHRIWEFGPFRLDETERLLLRAGEPVVLTPKVFGPSGEQEFLCKRRPTVLDLGLRAFAPASIKRLFAQRLNRYEMRDVTRDAVVTGLEQVSGAFMLFRRDALTRLGGFDDGYFLYFEDFDLSRRAMASATSW